MKALDLSPAASTAEAEALLDGLRSVAEKWSVIRATRRRIEHMRTNAQTFAERVRTLAAGCSPELAGRPAQEAAAELVKRLRDARSARDTRDGLDKQLAEADEELLAVQGEIEREEDVLEQLVTQAGVRTVNELDEAEQRSADRRELESRLKAAMERLREEGVPIENLIEEARDVVADTLPGQRDAERTTLAESETQMESLQERRAELRVQLDAMDGTSEAADQAALAQRALADVRTHAETYARLTLAARMLEDEVERYRRENQGPILRRAGEMFRRITCGSFAGLTTGFDKNDKTVLLGERPDGQTLPIDALSDGTCDQLYLALRLASLEQRSLANEPLPLILDDLLINFDDARARATLGLLSEMSQTRQILFFTHHARLLELADAEVPAERRQQHDLQALREASPA